MQHVAKLATTRISEGHSAKEAIEERRTVLLQLWENVKVASGQRKASLARARELHTFNRDAAETKSRVQVCTYIHVSQLPIDSPNSVSFLPKFVLEQDLDRVRKLRTCRLLFVHQQWLNTEHVVESYSNFLYMYLYVNGAAIHSQIQ